VIDLIQHRYDNTNQHFLWSPKFSELIDQCSANIIDQPSRKYVHILKLVEDLKLYKGKPLKHLLRTSGQPFQPLSPSDEPLRKRIRMDEEALEHSGSKSTSLCSLIPLSVLGQKPISCADETLVTHTASKLSGKSSKRSDIAYQCFPPKVPCKLFPNVVGCVLVKLRDNSDSIHG
jgi:hypothetical protein